MSGHINGISRYVHSVLLIPLGARNVPLKRPSQLAREGAAWLTQEEYGPADTQDPDSYQQRCQRYITEPWRMRYISLTHWVEPTKKDVEAAVRSVRVRDPDVQRYAMVAAASTDEMKAMLGADDPQSYDLWTLGTADIGPRGGVNFNWRDPATYVWEIGDFK